MFSWCRSGVVYIIIEFHSTITDCIFSKGVQLQIPTTDLNFTGESQVQRLKELMIWRHT